MGEVRERRMQVLGIPGDLPEVMPDHAHLFVSVPPKWSRRIGPAHPELRRGGSGSHLAQISGRRCLKPSSTVQPGIWSAPSRCVTASQERREAYRKAGKTVGFYKQKRSLPGIRAELPEYKGIHSRVLQSVVRGFFRRVKQGQTPGGRAAGAPLNHRAPPFPGRQTEDRHSEREMVRAPQSTGPTRHRPAGLLARKRIANLQREVTNP